MNLKSNVAFALCTGLEPIEFPANGEFLVSSFMVDFQREECGMQLAKQTN